MKLLWGVFLLIFIHSYICQENKPRILNGFEAPTDAFPWMVSIRLSLFGQLIHICGGAIISDTFVLTAASCLQPAIIFPNLLSIKAGIHDFYNESEETEQLRNVSQIILHPNYTSNNQLNNIALAKVSLPFNIKTLSVSTISISNLALLENINLTTIGWGFTTNQTNSSISTSSLQQITVQENIQCTQNLSINPMTQLCAAGRR
jgi:secreted trypsin-like serine protease